MPISISCTLHAHIHPSVPSVIFCIYQFHFDMAAPSGVESILWGKSQLGNEANSLCFLLSLQSILWVASYLLCSKWANRKDTWEKELTIAHWDGETHVSSYSGSNLWPSEHLKEQEWRTQNSEKHRHLALKSSFTWHNYKSISIQGSHIINLIIKPDAKMWLESGKLLPCPAPQLNLH